VCLPAAWGLLVYGLLVFCMEFLPFGAVNPPEVAEYFTMVGETLQRAHGGGRLGSLAGRKMWVCADNMRLNRLIGHSQGCSLTITL
jgi:hypothetical protein